MERRSQTIKHGLMSMLIFLLSLASLCIGWQFHSVAVLAGGLLAMCYLIALLVSRGLLTLEQAAGAQSAATPAVAPHPPARRKVPDAGDTEGLIEEMLAQGRYALLLRPQIVGNLGEAFFAQAMRALEQHMALVPDGEVTLGDEEEEPGRTVAVDRFFLDRYPVCNRQFYEFVTGGGYEQMALWHPTVLPALLDFVDSSGRPGPRGWKNGCYLPGEENHPVVGISWYEAWACARWLGKRLPSDAEWVKAGSWPVPLCPDKALQRRYPWGDTMDPQRANLWGTGPNRIVAVDEFAEGVSVGGVYQLIGNVWEWTSGTFASSDDRRGGAIVSGPLRSIRGGAFDTYFDTQATCQFQSGENPLSRRHNIGFRCAIAASDLRLARHDAEPHSTAESAVNAAEVLA